MTDLSFGSRITFDDQAGDSWSRMISGLVGYVVAVDPEDGDPFDAELLGTGEGDQWNVIRVRQFDEDKGVAFGPEVDVTVKSIHVY